MKPLISIIVTAYNLENQIARALDSILIQTYSNLEIVIVDDGSFDSTSRICDEYAMKDPRVIVVHKKNQGLAAARKTGVECAKGDYIGFVDADDTIDPDMYFFLIHNALKYSADISHCGYKMIMTDNSIKEFYGTEKVVIQNHDQGIVDLLEGEFIEPTVCNKLYKCSLFDSVQYVTNVKINEDFMLNSMLFQASNNSIYVDVCKYNYFKYEVSMSASVSERHFIDPIIIREKICENYVNETEKVRALAKRKLVMQYISNCFRIKEEGLKEYKSIYLNNREALKEQIDSVALSRNERIKAALVIHAPFLCRPFHSAYKLIHGKGKYA